MKCTGKCTGKILIEYIVDIEKGVKLFSRRVDILVQECFDNELNILNIDDNKKKIKISCYGRQGNRFLFKISLL
jgi:hypothetical protein